MGIQPPSFVTRLLPMRLNPSLHRSSELFLGNIASGWMVTATDQSNVNTFRSLDLQVGGITASSTSIAVPMKHKMGLVKITLGTKSVPTTRTYSASGTQAADASGMKYTDSSENTTVTASSSFDSSCLPYNPSSGNYWYIVRGSTTSDTYTKTFKSVTTVNTDWEYANVSVNQGAYLNITVNNSYIKRLCYKFTALFSCTETVQSFKLPLLGSCTYECWGARGGNGAGNQSARLGGYPGYTVGTASFATGTHFYIYVGAVGSRTYAGISEGGSNNAYNTGGWNGGGASGNNAGHSIGAGGGGATDIRLVQHSESNGWGGLVSLRSRIMVAAGGGGASSFNGTNNTTGNGGAGGGLTGATGIQGATQYTDSQYANTGGGQTSTGTCTFYNTYSEVSNVDAEHNPFGVFGYARGGENIWWGGGAGGGWYGGVQGFGRSGSGGSSFISGHPGCYAVNQNTSTSTTTYHKSGTNKERYDDTYYFTGTSMTAGATNSPGGNNGYARITMVTPVNN